MFEPYLKKGLLKKQRPNWTQIEAQVRLARNDLRTAEPVLAVDASWSATMVYQAMLRAGRALLMFGTPYNRDDSPFRIFVLFPRAFPSPHRGRG